MENRDSSFAWFMYLSMQSERNHRFYQRPALLVRVVLSSRNLGSSHDDS